MKLKTLNLDCQESFSLHFENILSHDTPKTLFGKNLLNMSPSFREHFVLNQDVFLLFDFVSLSVFVISEFMIMFLTQWYIL